MEDIIEDLELHKLKIPDPPVSIDDIKRVIKHEAIPSFKLKSEHHGYLLIIVNGIILLIFALCLCKINKRVNYIAMVPAASAEILINNNLTEPEVTSCASIHVIYASIFLVLIILAAATQCKSGKRVNRIVLFINDRDLRYNIMHTVLEFSPRLNCMQPLINEFQYDIERSGSACKRTMKIIFDPKGSDMLTLTLSKCDRDFNIPLTVDINKSSVWKLRNTVTDHIQLQIGIITYQGHVHLAQEIAQARSRSNSSATENRELTPRFLYPNLPPLSYN